MFHQDYRSIIDIFYQIAVVLKQCLQNSYQCTWMSLSVVCVNCTTNDTKTTFLIGLFQCTVSPLSNSVLNILQCDETDRLADLKDKLFSPSTILPTTLIAANVSHKYNFAIRNRYVLTQCPLTLNEQACLRNQSSAFCFSIISL